MRALLLQRLFFNVMPCYHLCFFFFSSRRRHTRSTRDWSSDVCSSDLAVGLPRTGVCKPDGETHEVQNLYIADGSLFPSALGVNPQITILALATGIARDLAKKGI